MNIVNLITAKNDQLRQPLQDCGFAVNEFPPSAGNDIIEENIIKGRNNYSILEISGDDNLSSAAFTYKVSLLYAKSKLICFTENFTPALRKFLLKTGISDCITEFSPERTASYIQHLNIKPAGRDGAFLILDDNPLQKNMLNSIIKRFGYKTLFAEDVDDLLIKTGSPDTVMTLINIGTSQLDLNGLVRKSFNNSDIKKNPVITYKCMEQGLFVHEIINGLNRLTKMILSPEELYCMLTDMLFKKEITSYTDSYITSLKYDRFRQYGSKSLQQIYYDNNGVPGAGDSLFEKNRIDSMIDTAEMIRKTLIRAEGIIWLRQSEDSQKKPICGAGA